LIRIVGIQYLCPVLERFSMGEVTINMTINYVGLDGEVHRGTTKRDMYIAPGFKSPENGEYYGEEFLRNGKKKIRIISKGDYLNLLGDNLNSTGKKPITSKAISQQRDGLGSNLDISSIIIYSLLISFVLALLGSFTGVNILALPFSLLSLLLILICIVLPIYNLFTTEKEGIAGRSNNNINNAKTKTSINIGALFKTLLLIGLLILLMKSCRSQNIDDWLEHDGRHEHDEHW
jgi:hypothetical protein